MRVSTVIGAAILALAAWAWWARGGTPGAEPPPANPIEARQRQLLRDNAGREGDPELGAAYHVINAKHFAGALPAIAVRWEPGLADVGAVADRDFTLDGMFGRIGTRQIILLNPRLKTDRPALTRALCHEMVHAFLFESGETTTNHGPAFKEVLNRLSSEGAFEGIPASAQERASLKAWLDEESARLDAEKTAVDAMRPTVTPENADAFNERLLRDQKDLAHFNAEVTRYNLMIVYPDGVD
jgi:hypothetical protein